jgi:hypothetical protein
MVKAECIAKAKRQGKYLEIKGSMTPAILKRMHAFDVVVFQGRVIKNRWGQVEKGWNE